MVFGLITYKHDLDIYFICDVSLDVHTVLLSFAYEKVKNSTGMLLGITVFLLLGIEDKCAQKYRDKG